MRTTWRRCGQRAPRCASAWRRPLAPSAHDSRAVPTSCKESYMKSSIRAVATSTPAVILKLAAVLAFATASLFAPQPARANRLGTDIIALFPKEVGEFAYADLKKARTMPWFPQLQQQMLPDRFKQFEKFLASAGVDPNSQVEELAWGLVAEGMTAKTEGTGSTDVPTGEEIVGVALGTYNPNSTEAFFKQQKLSTFKSRGYTLYAFGTGSVANDLFFFFIDSNTAG